MWWAISALTTVGYGDVTPITTVGKILGSFITIIGIGIVALPTSIFASGYAHVLLRSERILQHEAREAVSDGIVTSQEAVHFEELASKLNVQPEIAREIIDAVVRGHDSLDVPDCPHCGKSISS